MLVTLTWVFAGEGESTWLFVLRPIVMGMFSSAVLLFGQVVWIDAVDYDYRRTGLRREGTFTSVYVFIERLGYSLAPVILGALLQGMGFDKNLPLEAQSKSAELAVMIAMVGIPALTFGLSLLLLKFYDLADEKLAATMPPAGRRLGLSAAVRTAFRGPLCTHVARHDMALDLPSEEPGSSQLDETRAGALRVQSGGHYPAGDRSADQVGREHMAEGLVWQVGKFAAAPCVARVVDPDSDVAQASR